MSHIAVIFLLSDIVLTPHAGRLDAASFRERERAHAVLGAAGELARPTLNRCYASGTAEARRRAAILIARIDACLWVTVQRLAWDNTVTPPWIHVNGWHTDTATRYLLRAQDAGQPNTAPDWPAYRHATRLWIRDRIDEGAYPSVILREVDLMRAAEAAYLNP